MADLIRREAALAILYECGGDEITPPNMVEMRGRMYKLPAVDAVEVVRCKDCKYVHLTFEGRMVCGAVANANWVNKNHFCSYGERREET